jgi:cobalt-zinc-cadmium efflux system outer membrane protein
LVSALQIPLRKRLAGANLEAAKVAVADVVVNLALDTKAAFYRLQGALQMVELRRNVTAATALSRDVAERQYAAGNISDLDLGTERALNEEAKIELAIAESDVQTEREGLNTLLGLWGERTEWTLGEQLPDLPEGDVPASGLETLAVSQRLDLEAARVRTVGAVQQYQLGRFYGLVPSASLGSKAEREVSGGWSLGPALDLPIPLFDQSQAMLAANAARIRGSEERYAALAIAIRSQVRRAWTRLEGARARALYYRTVVVPLEERIVEEAQRQYNGMFIGVFQLLQAKREQVETGRRYVEALTDYWVSRTELERSVGGEFRLAGTRMPSASPAAPTEDVPSHAHHHGG